MPSQSHIKNQKPSSSISSSLKELILEAELLFKILDDASDKIRELESSLSHLKAHFPFRYVIKEENESFRKDLEEKHKTVCSYGHYYFTKVYWYLAWEVDEASKNFRLLLISEEKEIIEYVNDENNYDSIIFETRSATKKPLIETDLSTRLRNSEHLIPFIDSFKEFLKGYRISILLGTAPV